jgi:hypothetical protein
MTATPRPVSGGGGGGGGGGGAISGKLYTWGNGLYGQTGLGITSSRYSPIQVGALTTWKQSSQGDYIGVAIKTDGTIWTWGRNVNGSLGLGNTTDYSSPKQVGALTTWDKVTCSIGTTGGSMLAVQTDGTLWTWGLGSSIMGLGNATSYSSPKQIGALTNWSKVSRHKFNSAAIKTDGTLWTWGTGTKGQLGTGAVASKSSPVQVGALTNWATVSCGAYHMMAVKTDGTLWAWGYNNNGQLGSNNLTSYSSPIQIGASTNWLAVAAGQYTSLAIKTDGTLWSWGSAGSFGQGGLGDAVTRSSPTQVGALTNWSAVSIGGQHVHALKTNGTLWSWGRGGPQLGLGPGNSTYYSSPVQAGSMTTWLAIADRLGVAAASAISS